MVKQKSVKVHWGVSMPLIIEIICEVKGELLRMPYFFFLDNVGFMFRYVDKF